MMLTNKEQTGGLEKLGNIETVKKMYALFASKDNDAIRQFIQLYNKMELI